MCTTLSHVGSGGTAPLFLKLGTGSQWVMAWRLGRFTHLVKEVRLGPWRWSGRFGATRNLFSLAWFEPQYVGCPARTYAGWRAAGRWHPAEATTSSVEQKTSDFAVRSPWCCGRCDVQEQLHLRCRKPHCCFMLRVEGCTVYLFVCLFNLLALDFFLNFSTPCI